MRVSARTKRQLGILRATFAVERQGIGRSRWSLRESLVWLPRILPPRLLISDCKKSAPNSGGRHLTVARNGVLRAAQQASHIRHELDAGNRPHDVSPLS